MSTTRFDLADYLALPEGYPAELVDGMLVKQPSPRYGHQKLLTVLTSLLLPRVGPGRVLQAPVDVIVDRFNVFQPDLVVFEEEPPSDAAAGQMPLLAIEVLSPRTARRDREHKVPRLVAAGCREVWLIAWQDGWIERVTAQGTVRAGGAESLPSTVLAEFALSLQGLLASLRA